MWKRQPPSILDEWNGYPETFSLPRVLEISKQQLLSWISSSGKKVVGCPCFNFSDWVRNKNSLVGGTPDALNTLLPSRPCCFFKVQYEGRSLGCAWWTNLRKIWYESALLNHCCTEGCGKYNNNKIQINISFFFPTSLVNYLSNVFHVIITKLIEVINLKQIKHSLFFAGNARLCILNINLYPTSN